jgi:exoribonuclease R
MFDWFLGVDRLAFSVIWKLDKDGKIVDVPFFGRTIICSRAKLSYEHAQTFIEGFESWEAGRQAGKDLKPVELSGGITENEIKQTVLDLWGIATAIRKTRYEEGALSLNNVKLWFSLDSEGNPQACGPYIMKEANKLIEEFMLLANMSVARKIVVAFPEVALLRQHSPPKEKTILEFIQQANALGFSQFNEEEISAGELEKAFQQIEDPVKKSVLELL